MAQVFDIGNIEVSTTAAGGKPNMAEVLDNLIKMRHAGRSGTTIGMKLSGGDAVVLHMRSHGFNPQATASSAAAAAFPPQNASPAPQVVQTPVASVAAPVEAPEPPVSVVLESKITVSRPFSFRK